MTITREAWQRDLLNRIKSSMPELSRAGISSGYVIIAASAILPVLVAGVGWPAALATMVGSVGANLISNIVQGAKNEVDVARKLQTLPLNDPTHEHIRMLLEKLDAYNVIQRGLPEDDWRRLEILLDRKFSQYSLGAHNSQPELDAPILSENVNKQRAREIGYASIKKAWWIKKKGIGKSRLELYCWPIVFYDADYMVRYQTERHEDDKDSEGRVVNTRTITSPGTSHDRVEIVLLPASITSRGAQAFPEKIYNVINGLELEREIDWGRNAVARFSYNYLLVPLFFSRPRSNVKKLKYWETKIAYSSTHGALQVEKDTVLSDARHLSERYLVKVWTTSSRTVKETIPGPEKIRAAQYPFWVFGADSPSGFYQIATDGLSGNVLFMQAPASLPAHIVASLVGSVVIAFCVALLVWILYSILPLLRIFFA